MSPRTSKPPNGQPPLVALAVNSLWNVTNFRMGLIAALQAEGCRIVVLAPPGEGSEQLASRGVAVAPIAMSPRGTSPFADARLLADYYRTLRRLRPAALLAFTAKPNIYGSLAAHALGIPVVNNVAGLGSVFTRETWLTRLLVGLYRLALRRSGTVFFQNPDDRELFVSRAIVREPQAQLIPGSGVDLKRFQPSDVPGEEGEPFTFLLPARLLWAKGLAEYVEAARRLRASGASARFQLLGFVDAADPASVSPAQLERWRSEDGIEYLGVAADVRPILAKADCVVLPSYYREGVPRALLEAAAMGKPVITTDAVGCREAVDDGQSGLLCTPRSAESLAGAMASILQLGPDERRRMGAAGRSKMERQFGEQVIHEAYASALRRFRVIRRPEDPADRRVGSSPAAAG